MTGGGRLQTCTGLRTATVGASVTAIGIRDPDLQTIIDMKEGRDPPPHHDTLDRRPLTRVWSLAQVITFYFDFSIEIGKSMEPGVQKRPTGVLKLTSYVASGSQRYKVNVRCGMLDAESLHNCRKRALILCLWKNFLHTYPW